MRPTITFEGSLVSKSELQTSKSGVEFVRLSLARNYQEKTQNGEYKNTGTIFVNAVAFGHVAKCFANSDVAPGTLLLVHGILNGNKRPAYTNKEGVEYPESFEEQLTVESFGVSFAMNQTVTVSRKGTKSTTSPQTVSTPTKETTSTPEFDFNSVKSKVESGVLADFDDNMDDDFDDIFS